METLVIISMCLFALYLGVMALTYGVREYVSDNYYIGRSSWLFSVVMGVSGGLLLPAMLEKGGNFGFLALFAAFGILLVALAPHYKIEKIHNIGAYMALICGVGWVATFHPMIVLGVIAGWFIYWLMELPKPYYIGEVIAFGLIYGNLLLN